MLTDLLEHLLHGLLLLHLLRLDEGLHGSLGLRLLVDLVGLLQGGRDQSGRGISSRLAQAERVLTVEILSLGLSLLRRIGIRGRLHQLGGLLQLLALDHTAIL